VKCVQHSTEFYAPSASEEDSPSSNKRVALDECDLIFCTQEMSYQFQRLYSVGNKMLHFMLMLCLKIVAMLKLDSARLILPALSNMCVFHTIHQHAGALQVAIKMEKNQSRHKPNCIQDMFASKM
jgi:hypothetical protein